MADIQVVHGVVTGVREGRGGREKGLVEPRLEVREV